MPQRLRGQETFLAIVSGGALQDRIDSIQSFEWTMNMEIQEEEFLGEVQPRFDSIAKGASLSISGHMSNRSFVDFMKVVQQKSKRTPGFSRIDIGTRYVYPNGDVQDMEFRDLSFGDISVPSSSRSDYVEFSFDAQTKDVVVVPA